MVSFVGPTGSGAIPPAPDEAALLWLVLDEAAELDAPPLPEVMPRLWSRPQAKAQSIEAARESSASERWRTPRAYRARRRKCGFNSPDLQRSRSAGDTRGSTAKASSGRRRASRQAPSWISPTRRVAR